MKLQESGEMYLETVLVLTREGKTVRSVDVSDHMGVSKPSVSRAIHLLEDGGYITIEPTGTILLTKEGEAVAERIYERHTVISDLLIRIGVDEETATQDACRIEHVISQDSFNALKKLIADNCKSFGNKDKGETL